MPRIARITELNYPHHIVQRGNNKEIVFRDDQDRGFYLKLVRKYITECGCRINTYCLMNNHIHMVLVPLCDDAISRTMQKLSLRYTQYANRRYERTGRLWECRFYSSVIDKDSHLWAVCRYVERNPVRAQIVHVPHLYKWSSAGARHHEGKEHGFVEPIWYNETEKEDYLNFVNLPEQEDETRNIRTATCKGMPIGSEEFIKVVSEKLDINLTRRPKGRPRKEKMGCVPIF